MSHKKRIFSAVLIALSLATQAHAMGKKHKPEPTPTVTPSPMPSPAQSIVLTPETLLNSVLSGNLTIAQELINVKQAKDLQTGALAKLLPSINASAILGSTTGGPTFLLSAVSFLVPFIVHSNWLNLAESEHQLKAEEASYHIQELNQFASAYTLYETIVNEYDALAVLQSNYDTLYQLYLTLSMENQQTGNVSLTDVKNALDQAEDARGSVLEMQKDILIDQANLKTAMGIGSSTVVLDFSQRKHVPASDAESLTPDQISARAMSVAPENTQLSELRSAANDAKWSAIFGFVTGGTLSTVSNSNSGGGSQGG